jgi:hypothetical protein
MELAYSMRYQVLPELVRFRNLFLLAQLFKQARHESLRDWLGGYPYEFSLADEIFRFCSRECGFTLVNLRTVNSLGLNEFLFHR